MLASSAHNHGALSDRFGLLSKDRTRLDLKGLEKLTGLNRAQVAPMLGKSKTSTYKLDEVRLSTEILEKVLKVAVVADLAFEMLGNDLNETRTWVMAPNLNFFGNSPFDVCMTGQGDKVIEWLLVRTGRQVGQAF